MKKWYQWFYVALGFAVGGVINYCQGKQIIASVIQVSCMVIMAMIQFFCDQKGEKGKKAFRYISIGIIVAAVIWLIYILFRALG